MGKEAAIPEEVSKNKKSRMFKKLTERCTPPMGRHLNKHTARPTHKNTDNQINDDMDSVSSDTLTENLSILNSRISPTLSKNSNKSISNSPVMARKFIGSPDLNRQSEESPVFSPLIRRGSLRFKKLKSVNDAWAEKQKKFRFSYKSKVIE